MSHPEEMLPPPNTTLGSSMSDSNPNPDSRVVPSQGSDVSAGQAAFELRSTEDLAGNVSTHLPSECWPKSEEDKENLCSILKKDTALIRSTAEAEIRAGKVKENVRHYNPDGWLLSDTGRGAYGRTLCPGCHCFFCPRCYWIGNKEADEPEAEVFEHWCIEHSKLWFVCPPPCGRAEADPDAFVEHFKEADHVEIDDPMLDAFVDSEELSQELHDNFDIRLRNGYTTLLHEDFLKSFDPASRKIPSRPNYSSGHSAQELKDKEEEVVRKWEEGLAKTTERLKVTPELSALLARIKLQLEDDSPQISPAELYDYCGICLENNIFHPEHPKK